MPIGRCERCNEASEGDGLPLWCGSLRMIPRSTLASYSCIGPWLTGLTVRRQRLGPLATQYGSVTPRGCLSPCSTVDAATVDARLVPDIRPAHAVLCRDGLLRRIWRRASVGWFARPADVQNRCRECRGTKARGRAAARSRVKGVRILLTGRVCGAFGAARKAAGYEAPAVGRSRSQTSAMMWASLKVGLCPDTGIIWQNPRRTSNNPSPKNVRQG